MTDSTAPRTVALIYGGTSTEHGVSCVSAGQVLEPLSRHVRVLPVGISRSGRWTQGVSDAAELVAHGDQLPEVSETAREVSLSLNPARRGEFRFVDDGSLYGTADVMFPLLHGVNGEDGTIQGLFELCGVPYVGTGVLSSAAGMDKEFTKKLLAAAGLPVADGVVLRPGEGLGEADAARLDLPVFVKPARSGSSIGVSKVSARGELPAALDLAFSVDTKALVEAEVHGTEIEVGVLEYPDGRVVASPPAQLNGTDESSEGFYGFQTKYVDASVRPEIPAPLPEATIARLKEMAVAAFRALDCRGLARVDFFVTAEGPLINEINTMPGFTTISMFPQVFAADGLPYDELLRVMVETALVGRPGAEG